MTPLLRLVQGDATQPVGPGPKVIVHLCNDVGAWGKGFVLALGHRYPAARQQYRAWAQGHDALPFALGQVQFVTVQPYLHVAHLIGQHGIARKDRKPQEPPIRYEAVREGLGRVRDFAQQQQASIHMPRIGTGLAGGDWTVILGLIEAELLAADLQVTVYDLP
ncbi:MULTISPECIES: macro domain-containing protein [Deinococcus]|uniref:Helicase-like protein n=1 Tax=Deinococcus gobiensis (strain DSM 21396 / JCM 16679 / CGMCC 1.7299 / I-0) TaxID=745776 RepID=H8H2X4_DEIGI|nr:macro domain-containing protein [Deinococcus gobiensis]AFD27871.1 Helicase-like protein [Deinococcus gobiensis I-0]